MVPAYGAPSWETVGAPPAKFCLKIALTVLSETIKSPDNSLAKPDSVMPTIPELNKITDRTTIANLFAQIPNDFELGLKLFICIALFATIL